jgi:hypothetical protein
MSTVRQEMARKCAQADPSRWAGVEVIPPDDRLPRAEVLRRIHRCNIAFARALGRTHGANWSQASNTILPPSGYASVAD